MSSLKRTLSLRDGITLAIGSIIGSGVLFLPALTYQLAGSDVMVVWIVATLLCFPLLKVFSDMVNHVPSERGVEGFVSLGLGRHLGSSVPLLFLGTVTIGMPSAAIIAGQYVTQFMGSTELGIVTSCLLVALGVGANFGGVKLGGRINSIVAALLFVVGGVLVALTTPAAIQGYHKLIPQFELQPILAGVVVAFWAYAGFENLTFISGEFKNPRRDFTISMLVALLVCGFLYLILSINFASLVDRSSIDSFAGLAQLANSAELSDSVLLSITMFAVFAVAINFVSWTWGISRLVYSSATQGFLPLVLSKLKDSNPRNATSFLGVIFFCVLTFAHLNPSYFQKGLVVVSTNFVLIYILCMISYAVYEKSFYKKLLGAGVALGLSYVLTSSGPLLLYPLSIIAVAFVLSIRRSQKK